MAETRRIFKYYLPVKSGTIPILAGAQFLHFGEQEGETFVWFLVNPYESVVDFKYFVAATGYDEIPAGYFHYQTRQMKNGLVWHLFGEIL